MFSNCLELAALCESNESFNKCSRNIFRANFNCICLFNELLDLYFSHS